MKGTTKNIHQKLLLFYPWIPLRGERIPCSADWVITIVEPIENLKKLYQEKLDGRTKVIKVLLLSSQEIVVSEIEESLQSLEIQTVN